MANSRQMIRATPVTRIEDRRRGSSAHPTIVTTNMDLAVATGEAIAAVLKADNPPSLYALGDSPVRVEQHPVDGRPVARELTEARLIHHMARAITWAKVVPGGDLRSALPSVPVARNILAAPSVPFPPLERIVEVPVFARSGERCATPGYHRGARLLYHPSPQLRVPTVPDAPTDSEIERARVLLCDELLGDFPFAGPAERAHALALLLLPFVRDLIDGPTPLHVIEKPTAGTGGSLLADVLMRPALGRALPAITAGRDAEEWRKQITALLGESPTAVRFDNVRRLDGDALAAALTATTWNDRRLGVSRVVTFPVRCAWIATANNPVLSFEIARRTVRIRLDSGIDRPWLRTDFRHADLVGWTMTHRGDLVAAALTLVQAWIRRGQVPGTVRPLGSYESWSRVMGGILEVGGVGGFLGNLTNLYEASVDDETRSGHALVAAWWGRYGGAAVGVKEIWALSQEAAVELDLGTEGERSQRTRLGKLLGRMRDRVFGVYRVAPAGELHGSQRWRLIRQSPGCLSLGADVEEVVDVSSATPRPSPAFPDGG